MQELFLFSNEHEKYPDKNLEGVVSESPRLLNYSNAYCITLHITRQSKPILGEERGPKDKLKLCFEVLIIFGNATYIRPWRGSCVCVRVRLGRDVHCTIFRYVDSHCCGTDLVQVGRVPCSENGMRPAPKSNDN
jgi:hypothetical protein